jgi:hypothetical protein
MVHDNDFPHPPGHDSDLEVHSGNHVRQIGQDTLQTAVETVTIWKQKLGNVAWLAGGWSEWHILRTNAPVPVEIRSQHGPGFFAWNFLL